MRGILMKKIVSMLAILLMAFVLFAESGVTTAEATTSTAAKWGKITFKKGMIGKVAVIKDTNVYLKQKDGKYKASGKVRKGAEIGVYSFSKSLYGIGTNKYIKKTSAIKYFVAPKSIYEKVNPENFVINILKTDKDHTLYNNDGFILFYEKDNTIGLGYQGPMWGDDLWYYGKLSNVTNSKATITYVYAYNEKKKGTGTFTMSKGHLVLNYIEEDGSKQTVYFNKYK
jgi:hypothetical protein